MAFDEKARAELRVLAKQYPEGLSLRRIASYAWGENIGLGGDEAIRTLAFRAYVAQVKHVLKQPEPGDPDGVPFMQPLSRGPAAVWRQLRLFDREQAIGLLQMTRDMIGEDILKYRRMKQWLERRFGPLEIGDGGPDAPLPAA